MNWFLVITLSVLVLVLPGLGLILHHFYTIGERAIGKGPMGETRCEKEGLSCR